MRQTVNSFSTRRLSSCTDEYAHMYDMGWVGLGKV